MTYSINTKTTNATINSELKLTRATDKTAALNLRKAYNSMLNKEFTELPQVGADLVPYITNRNIADFIKPALANILVELIDFTEVECDEPAELVDQPSTDISIDVETATATELTQVLFDDLDHEIQGKITAMTTGLKLKLDLLDELKATLLDAYPDIQTEVLTAKLANALAVTKLKTGSSLSLIDGSLAVYDYMATDIDADSKNFEFMADIIGDKTKSLEILILQSAFKSYKEEVSRGKLPMTSAKLNLAIAKAVSGIQQTTDETKAKISNLF